MNEDVRLAVKERLGKRGLSQADLAKAVGMERPNITRMLAGRSGQIPENWQKILDYLDLELVVKPKDGGA